MENYFIAPDVKLGKNVIIEPFVFIGENCEIGDNTVVASFTKLKNVKVGSNTVIESSHIENSTIGNDCTIGPMAKIKGNSVIEDNVTIGNFVEIKNSVIKSGTKAKHLSYIGDAEVGNNCNIGCGVIFANYDGKHKYRTKLENNVFVGCNSVLIAPLNIEKNCYICAGTVVNRDARENDFIIGRSQMVIKENRAEKYLKNKE